MVLVELSPLTQLDWLAVRSLNRSLECPECPCVGVTVGCVGVEHNTTSPFRFLCLNTCRVRHFVFCSFFT